MRSSIAKLCVGECFSRSERYRLDDMTRESLREAHDRLRNTIKPAANRASQETGNKFSIELGDWHTANRDIVVTAIVTRIS
jgi:hypothetical protein